MPKISKKCKNTPFLLVGTQIDLRKNNKVARKLGIKRKKPLSFENCKKYSETVKAVEYVECSALTHQGIKNVFDEAILAVIQPKEIKDKNCSCKLM